MKNKIRRQKNLKKAICFEIERQKFNPLFFLKAKKVFIATFYKLIKFLSQLTKYEF